MKADPAILHESQHKQAMFDLFETLCKLTPEAPKTCHPSVAQARLEVEATTIRLIPGLAYEPEILRQTLKTPSLPVFLALLDGPGGQKWTDGFAQCLPHWNDMYHPETMVCFETGSAEFLHELWKRGVALHKSARAFPDRYLIEPGDKLDEIAAFMYAGFADPVLGALRDNPNPFKGMVRGQGIRHLYRLEAKLRAGDPGVGKFFHDLATQRHSQISWKTMALLLRIGVDCSDLCPAAPANLSPLLELSGSRHGQLKLHSLEPDLEEIAGREEHLPFFGLTQNEVNAAQKQAARTSS